MAFGNQTVWIIGASSGIGESLAKTLSTQGASLILSARNGNKLNALNDALGGSHYVLPFDIADFGATKTAIDAVKNLTPVVHRVICLAGAYEPSAIGDIKDEHIESIIAINLSGVIHLAKSLLPMLHDQESAQIALCSSVAGYVGLPNSQPYAASKAGLINFTQSMKAEAPSHIDVKLINPGFVKTPLTDKNSFDMPFIITPEEAAQHIVEGLESRKFEISFPKRFTRMLSVIAALPDCLRFRVIAKFK